MQQQSKTYLLTTIKILLFGTLAMPIIVGLQSYTYPFIVPKVLFFRILVGFAFLLFLVLAWQRAVVLPKKKNILIASGFFIFVAWLSSIFGRDFDHSFWGDFERMEGIISLIHVYVYFLMLSAVLQSRKAWLWFLQGLLGIGVIVFFSGLLQYLSPADDPFLMVGGGNRVSGTLGNPIYYGQFSLMLVWLGIILLFFGSKHWAWRATYAIVGIGLGIMGLVLSGSRGPFLALFASIVFFGFLVAVFSGSKKIRFISIFGSLAAIIIVIAAVFFNVPVIRDIPGVGGLQSIATGGGTASTRLMAWDIAWTGFLERPLLGWGWGNYALIFNEHYNPTFLNHGFEETWFDHAHSFYFDLISTAGIVGLLSYLLLIAVLARELLYLRKEHSEKPWIIFALASLFVAHLVQNIFAFEHPSSWFTFFTFLGFVLFLQSEGDQEDEEKKIERKRLLARKSLIIVSFIFGLYTLWYGNILGIQINRAAHDAAILFNEDPAAGAEEMKKVVVRQNPYDRSIRNDFSLSLLQLERLEPEDFGFEIFRGIVEFGIEMQGENVEQNPGDVRARVLLVQLYRELQMVGEDVAGTMEVHFEELARQSPQRQQIYFYWAESRMFEDRFPEAEEMIQRTIESEPKASAPYWVMARIHVAQENWQTANDYVTMAFEHGLSPTLEQARIMAHIERELQNAQE